MRFKEILTTFVASVAAVAPWTARGELLSDARHQRRHKAADILRAVLQETRATHRKQPGSTDVYRPAVAEAIRLVGPESTAARELTEALQQADDAGGSAAQLRERLAVLVERLAFAPTMEAEMPEGFPPPTPIDEVEIKQYPAYRMARAESGPDSSFWTLFNHIKRKKVAMTAPVEMSYEATEDAAPRQRSMAFLYGNRGLGDLGPDGSVRVVDVPPQTVVSIGVRGQWTAAEIASARARLKEWIDANSARYLPAGEMRVMGYNSPFLPRSRKYFEVQIPLRVKEVSLDESELGQFDLSEQIWKRRVLLAFAPSREDATYAPFRREWTAQSPAVAERDLLLVPAFEQGASHAADRRLTPATAAGLRKQFKVASGVPTFILIGKDGTVKLRRSRVRLSELFELIDSMPMRRAEISRQRRAGST